MKGYIGEFEELVLLTIASLGENAYGVAIKEDIEMRADRGISLGALHSTITRLEEVAPCVTPRRNLKRHTAHSRRHTSAAMRVTPQRRLRD